MSKKKPYEKCILNKEGGCGKDRSNSDGVIPATELNADVENHLQKLKISNVPLKFLNERNLIQDRLNRALFDEDFICSKHSLMESTGVNRNHVVTQAIRIKIVESLSRLHAQQHLRGYKSYLKILTCTFQ